jgi:hypothetical protein
MLCNLDLIRNPHKYDEQTLLANIDRLSIKTILHTQTLSEEFCAKYIYCVSNVNDGDEDSYLFDATHILNKQPHLDEQKFLRLIGA